MRLLSVCHSCDAAISAPLWHSFLRMYSLTNRITPGNCFVPSHVVRASNTKGQNCNGDVGGPAVPFSIVRVCGQKERSEISLTNPPGGVCVTVKEETSCRQDRVGRRGSSERDFLLIRRTCAGLKMFSSQPKIIKLNAARRTVVQLSPKQVREHTPRSVGAPIDVVRPKIAMQADFAAVRATRIPPTRRSVPEQLHAKPSKDAD